MRADDKATLPRVRTAVLGNVNVGKSGKIADWNILQYFETINKFLAKRLGGVRSFRGKTATGGPPARQRVAVATGRHID